VPDPSADAALVDATKVLRDLLYPGDSVGVGL